MRDLPDADALDDRFSDVLWAMAGAFLLRLGFRLWGVVPPEAPAGMLVLVLVYGTAIGVFAAAVTGFDTEQWGPHLAVWVALVMTFAVGFELMLRPDSQFGTDAVLFARYSTDLVLQGANPYVASMLPAAEQYGVNMTHITPTTAGGTVDSLSYPAGSVLAYLPQRVLGLGSLHLGETTVLFAMAGTVFASTSVREEFCAVPILAVLVPRNLVWASAGGVIDFLWVTPIIVCVAFWVTRRYGAAAVAYGIAAAMKQHAWILGPFLLIWQLKDRGPRAAARWVGTAIATFAVINLPFLLSAPRAWLYGVVTPLSGGGTEGSIVQQGAGLVQVSVSGVYPLANWWFAALLITVTAVLLAAYWMHFDRLKWMAWVTPAVILFFHYRSLNSYFAFAVPVGVYVIAARADPRAVDRKLRFCGRVFRALIPGVTRT